MAGRRVKAVERVETPVLTSFYGKLIGAGTLVLALAIFIGTRDSGQININGVINASNAEQAANAEVGGEAVQNVAAIPEALRNLPNGGLVPADPNAVPPPAPEPAPTPEDAASTTPENVEESSGEEEEPVSSSGEDSAPEGEPAPAN